MPKNFAGDDIDWEECAFFFVFCPNNSGSTILCQYLSSQIDGYLPPFGNFEGHMAPAVKKMMRQRPWDADSRFDWAFIRNRWNRLARGRVFVEGSPPNILRHQEIAKVFGADSTAIVSVCSPYQHIASSMRRYAKPGARVTPIVENWLMKAAHIAEIVDAYPHFLFLRHEHFVRRPDMLNEHLSIDTRPFVGKGKKGSWGEGVQDQSVRMAAFLEADEIDEITAALRPHADLLKRFDYPLHNGPHVHAELLERSEQEYEIGRARRAEWEKAASGAAWQANGGVRQWVRRLVRG